MLTVRTKSRQGRSKRGGRPARNLAAAGGPSAVSVPRPIRVNADSVFIFSRRCADLSVFCTSGGAISILVPPGFTGTPFMNLGTVGTDISPPGQSLIFATFAFGLDVTSLAQSNDLLSMFAEYQIRNCHFTAETLMGDSYNPTIQSPLPEIITVIDPTVATAPALVQTLMSYSNTQRQTLTLEHPHKRTFVPRPAVQVYGSVLATSYAANDRFTDLWFASNNTTQPPLYGLVVALRNFVSPVGSGVNVRFSCNVDVACRRPR
jgi:hypothetical protein